VGSVGKADALVGNQSSYDRGLPRRGEGCHINLASEQLLSRHLRLEREQFAQLLVEPAAFDEFKRKRARAATLGPDRNLPAAHAIGGKTRQLTAMENPQGFIEQRSKRLEVRRLAIADDAALDQCDVYAGARVA
jgi:hypothetical protein